MGAFDWLPSIRGSKKSALDRALSSAKSSKPKDDSYGRIVLDIWDGTAQPPPKTRPEKPPEPPATDWGSAIFTLALTAGLAIGGWALRDWSIIALILLWLLAAFFLLGAVSLLFASAVAPTPEPEPAPVVHPPSKIGLIDRFHLRSVSDTPEGKLAVAAANVAGSIAESLAWKDALLDAHHTRLNLPTQVTAIARSARTIADQREKLGPKPSGTLAEDAEVVAVYERGTQRLEMRVEALATRLQQFVDYRDHVRALDPIIEKRNYLQAHAVDDESDEFIAAASDELSADEIERASDELESRTQAALEFLLQYVKRISRM